MIAYTLSRRRFFARVIALAAAAGLAGCGRRRSGVGAGVLEAVLDTLIPADKDAGAVAAGVPARIMERIRHDPVSEKRYRRLLAWIGDKSRDAYASGFDELSLQQRERLLHALYDSTGSALVQLRIDLHVVLEDCFHEFYSSPAAQQVIGYHPPIEGGYPDYARSPEQVG